MNLEGVGTMKYLIVIDMQNDFISGSLGTKEAVRIVPAVIEKIRGFSGGVIATRDTHGENYLETREGQELPVPHCIKGTHGWEIQKDIASLISTTPFNKMTFGSEELCAYMKNLRKKPEEIVLIGVCTDICVISNALMLKAVLPETKITVDSACCAGVTPQSHKNALEAMKMCQIDVI